MGRVTAAHTNAARGSKDRAVCGVRPGVPVPSEVNLGTAPFGDAVPAGARWLSFLHVEFEMHVFRCRGI